MSTMPFDIIDAEDGTKKRVKGRVSIDERGIYIAFEKFGTVHDDIPILIEQVNGIPRVLVWLDKDVENATEVATLENARVKR